MDIPLGLHTSLGPMVLGSNMTLNLIPCKTEFTNASVSENLFIFPVSNNVIPVLDNLCDSHLEKKEQLLLRLASHACP
jgi:hypothetical protein